MTLPWWRTGFEMGISRITRNKNMTCGCASKNLYVFVYKYWSSRGLILLGNLL